MYHKRVPDGEKPVVHWLPFQLNPDLPETGIPRQQYIERKFGAGSVRNYSRISAIGKEVGIDFAFEDIAVQPNTLNAHRLMGYGARHGCEDEVAENIFHAYFQEGANLTDRKVLAKIGETAGLSRAALEAYLESDEDKDSVRNVDLTIRQAGVNGVPCFIFNRRKAISGAHEPEKLLEAIMDALSN
jgi:predicted DsbA family dithiol-disulfide isomerase